MFFWVQVWQLQYSDGSYRFCPDFRGLNDATITEIFPSPGQFVNAVIHCMDANSLQSWTSTVVIGRSPLLRIIAKRLHLQLNLVIGSFALCPLRLKMPQPFSHICICHVPHDWFLLQAQQSPHLLFHYGHQPSLRV